MNGGMMTYPNPSAGLEALGLAYARNRSVVLRDINLAVAVGEAVAVLGDNGAGKTTLLLCLAGCLTPARGEVRWLGERAAQSVASRRHIGFLGHETGLYSALTSLENLTFACRMWGLDAPHERAREFLAAMGLAQQAHIPVDRLSRGMRQRLAIARVVIHDPPVLLLDEPFTCLDSTGRNWFVHFLRYRRADGRAIVFTSHDARLCGAVADRLLVLRSGHLQSLDITMAPCSPVDELSCVEVAPGSTSSRGVVCA
jgi:heme exporter protein A